jgi:hypothetical protein
MVVAVEFEDLARWELSQEGSEQLGHSELDRLGIGASEQTLELGPTDLLAWGHGALAAQRAVGEVVEEPGSGADGEVGVEREELGELEGLETVDDERF